MPRTRAEASSFYPAQRMQPAFLRRRAYFLTLGPKRKDGSGVYFCVAYVELDGDYVYRPRLYNKSSVPFILNQASLLRALTHAADAYPDLSRAKTFHVEVLDCAVLLQRLISTKK